MKSKEIKKLVFKVSEGLFSTLTDTLLMQLFLTTSVGGGKTSRGAHQQLQQASELLEQINYQTLKNSFSYLKRKGFIRSLKEPSISRLGQQRLNNLIPQYQNKRPWDKAIYLIIYDVAEANRCHRDRLRTILKRLGAALVQASVWLTPYNPGKILKQFSATSNFQGEIIVSCIGKDGYIGEEKLNELINRVYHLEEINLQYQKLIANYQTKKQDNWLTAVNYLSILAADPQLPFPLLPDNWAGERAYAIYSNLTKKP